MSLPSEPPLFPYAQEREQEIAEARARFIYQRVEEMKGIQESRETISRIMGDTQMAEQIEDALTNTIQGGDKMLYRVLDTCCCELARREWEEEMITPALA
jgi:hypothetical protein